MPSNVPSILITGGAGFIGSHLAEALLDRGHKVTIVDDLSTGRLENIAHLTEHPRFRFAIDAITNEVVMDRLVSECQVIFHLAAAVGVQLIVRDPIRVIETNVLGTHAVLKLASRYRRKVLLASTSEVYGKGSGGAFREDDDLLLGPTTKARWSYSTSKAVDEFLGLAYHRQIDLPVIIFRLFNTVGPRQTGQYGMVLPRFVQQALAGQPLTVYGDGQQSRCFCHVQNAVSAIIGLSQCSEAIGKVFNIGSEDEISILDLAKRVIEVVDSLTSDDSAIPKNKSKISFVPYDQAYDTGFEDLRRRIPDTRKIRHYIGWHPSRTLDEIINDVVSYYKINSLNRETEPVAASLYYNNAFAQ
jgi:UDP-glucose 4-epimerase